MNIYIYIHMHIYIYGSGRAGGRVAVLVDSLTLDSFKEVPVNFNRVLS